MRLTRGRETQAPASKGAATYNLYGTGGLLDYDGQDMHHNIYLSSSVATGTCVVQAGVDGATWFTIVDKTIGEGEGKVSVYSTGTTVDLPFKFIRIVLDETTTVAVDSFGTEIR